MAADALAGAAGQHRDLGLLAGWRLGDDPDVRELWRGHAPGRLHAVSEARFRRHRGLGDLQSLDRGPAHGEPRDRLVPADRLEQLDFGQALESGRTSRGLLDESKRKAEAPTEASDLTDPAELERAQRAVAEQLAWAEQAEQRKRAAAEEQSRERLREASEREGAIERRLGELSAREDELRRSREGLVDAQDEARRSEKSLQLALDAAQMGTWEWQIATDRSHWSDKSKEIFGVDGMHPEFTLEPPGAGVVPDAVLDGGRLRVLPQAHGTDGAFAVRLRRAHG